MGTPYFYTYDFVSNTDKMQPSLDLRSEKLFYEYLYAVTVTFIAPSSSFLKKKINSGARGGVRC